MRILQILASVLVTAAALWLSALLLPGTHLGDDGATSGEQFLTIVLIAVIVIVIDSSIAPVVSVLGFPLTCATLGIFQLVINALMLLLSAAISSWFGLTLEFDSLWWALAAGIVIGVIRWALELAFSVPHNDERAASRRA